MCIGSIDCGGRGGPFPVDTVESLGCSGCNGSCQKRNVCGNDLISGSSSSCSCSTLVPVESDGLPAALLLFGLALFRRRR